MPPVTNLYTSGLMHALAVAALVAGMNSPLLAQDTKPPISVDVNVVNVLTTVRTKKGDIVTNLGQDDFKVEEDGRPQAITYFSRETDLPLTLGLLVDTSASQRRVLPEERTASQSFLDNMVREGRDQAFVIHFYCEVELLQDVTSSHQKLESALQLLEPARPADDSGSGTAEAAADIRAPDIPAEATQAAGAAIRHARERERRFTTLFISLRMR